MPDFFAAHPWTFAAALVAGILLAAVTRRLWLAVVGGLVLVVSLFAPGGLVVIGGLLVIGGGLLAGKLAGGGGIRVDVRGDGNTVNAVIDNSKGT